MTGVPLPAGGFAWQPAEPAGASCTGSAAAAGALTEGPWVEPVTIRVVAEVDWSAANMLVVE